jgi:hypothetical protein
VVFYQTFLWNTLLLLVVELVEETLAVVVVVVDTAQMLSVKLLDETPLLNQP